jgi:general secretion pathway protein H
MKSGTINGKGFTLLEMLIVLVIMSLLMTLVPPLFSNALPSLRLKTVVNDLSQDLVYIRDIAVLKGTKTLVVIDPEAGTYSSEDKDRGDEQVIPNDIKVTTSHIGLRDVEDKNPVIAFFADGSSSGGIVTLTRGERSYSIIVDWITGSVTQEEGAHDE